MGQAKAREVRDARLEREREQKVEERAQLLALFASIVYDKRERRQ